MNTKDPICASEVFALAIKDAENLLAHFDKLNTNPPPSDIEVLKRAGLVMAMTAWETYVEDRVSEVAAVRLAKVADGTIGDFFRSRLDEEIKRLNNPNAKKTLQLFKDFAGIDLTNRWAWDNLGPETVRERLNQYLKLRGDIVHRSRVVKSGPRTPQPVNREKLQKAILFLKKLVTATEAGLR